MRRQERSQMHPSHTTHRLMRLAALTAWASLFLLPAANASSGGKQSQTHYPVRVLLTNPVIAHWAVVVRRVGAHTEPSASSHVVTLLQPVTGDGTQNVVL